MTNQELLQIIEKAARNKETTLDLRNNQLTTLPEAIAQLSNLRELDLRNNQLTTLPEAIAQLSNLSWLYLRNNQLTTLPEAIAQLSNLRELYLRNNQLTTLPEAIAQLSNLRELDLRNNQLTTLPEAIAQLSNLSWLDLSNNQLTTLPEAIAQLSNLSWLDLRNNQLTTLPEAIAQLSNLSWLYLGNNQLTTLPEAIKQLSQLEKLDLRGNQLNIPAEILGSSWDSLGKPSQILTYYFSLATEEKQPLNEAKVLLVGQGTVGKTSLVKRLIDNTFDANESKTQGINIENWDLEVNGQNIRLNIWDFGGQEIMHATHQFFLTKRSLYLLVINARENEQQNRLEYWLRIIQSFGGDSPIILVGNKIDDHPLDLDQTGLRRKYENIKDIVPISCKNGSGIEKLLSIIKRELANLEGINDPLAKSWFQVKTHLEKMEKDYILYHEYQSICQNEKIIEELKQSTLIELLHQLGIVLNFRDDFGLKGVPVLNSEWVTSGVYKILNDNLLMTQFRGILTLKELRRILDSVKYPDDKPEFIIKMMEKFELCFPLDNENQYLIPDLLPKEEPATGEWENVLAFEYHYNILHSSIISRFIVRMHHQADKKTWWRSGIVLKYGNNRALLKSDQEDRKIFIFISGNSSTRRELLAIIRSQFDSIHQTIKGLEAKEKVPIPGYSGIFADYKNLLVYAERNSPYIPEGLTETFNALELLNGIESEAERRKRQNRERIESQKPRKPTMTQKPEKPTISSAERGIALAMALVVLIAFIVLILNPRSMNGNALAIVRFLASAFAGIAGYLVSGDLGLQASIPFMKTKTQVKATGAFAAFVLVFLLFYMGVPTSEITPQPTPTP